MTTLFNYSKNVNAIPFDSSCVELFAKVYSKLNLHSKSFNLLESLIKVNKLPSIQTIENIVTLMEIDNEHSLAIETFNLILDNSKPTLLLLNSILRCSIKCKVFNNVNLNHFQKFNIKPDQETFHALIYGHLINGNLNLSKHYLSLMRSYGFQDNISTHIAIFRAYRSLGFEYSLEYSALNDTAKLGLNADARVLNALMTLRVDSEDDKGALRIFNNFFDHHDTNQNKNLQSFVVQNLKSRFYDFKAPKPDFATYAILINLCAKGGDIHQALNYYNTCEYYIGKPNQHVNAALVRCYVKSGNIKGAIIGIQKGTIPASTPVLNALLKDGLMNDYDLKGLFKVLRLFKSKKMLPDSKTLELILMCLHHEGVPPSKLLRIMKRFILITRQQIPLNIRLFNIIRYCTSEHVRAFVSNKTSNNVIKTTPGVGKRYPTYIPSYESINEIQTEIERKGIKDDAMSSALKMRLLATSGEMNEAKELFQNLIRDGYKPNKYHFSALIEGAVKQSNFQLAFSIIDECIKYAVHPNTVMYSIIITGLAKAGEVAKANKLFDWVLSRRNKPTIESLNALITAHIENSNVIKGLLLYRKHIDLQSVIDSNNDSIKGTLYRLLDYTGYYKEADEVVKNVEMPSKMLRDVIRAMKKRRVKVKVQEIYPKSNWTKVHLKPGPHKHYKSNQLKRLTIEWCKVWLSSRRSKHFRIHNRIAKLSRYSNSKKYRYNRK